MPIMIYCVRSISIYFWVFILGFWNLSKITSLSMFKWTSHTISVLLSRNFVLSQFLLEHNNKILINQYTSHFWNQSLIALTKLTSSILRNHINSTKQWYLISLLSECFAKRMLINPQMHHLIQFYYLWSNEKN